MRVVSSLRMERDHKAIVVFQKVKVRITTYYLLKPPRSDGIDETLIKGIHILMFSEEEYMTTV
jgi:hypothetical protein